MNNEVMNSSDMMMYVMKLVTSKDSEIHNVWKKVVSKIKTSNDYEDSDKRMPVGERLAGNTRVVDLKNGVLLVETDHPGWIQYLKMYQKFILNGLKMEIPELNIKSLAFRSAGQNYKLYPSYEDSMKKEKEKLSKKMEQQDKELKNFYKDNEKKTSGSENLPPELLEKFESMKRSVLTNDEK